MFTRPAKANTAIVFSFLYVSVTTISVVVLLYIKKTKKSMLFCITINIQKGIISVKKYTRSLLEELNDVAVKKETEAVVETRAAHVINSAINLIKLMRENFEPDAAYELERRLINSIKGGDPSKFIRGIRKLRDSKHVKSHLKIVEGDDKFDD